jgi:epoxide hydrolase-like predicted phosphatase
MTIRAVFFDLGGVIVRTEYQAPRQHLAESFSMDYDDIDRIVFGSGSAVRASVGEITEEEHWRNVMQTLKLPASEYQRVRDEFFAGDVIDREIIDFLRSVKPKVKTGVISNAWSGLRNYIVREKFDDAFHHMVISAEVGVAKPDPKIYQIALEQLQVKAKEAVFVDDVLENIEACQQVGMQGIHFKDSPSVNPSRSSRCCEVILIHSFLQRRLSLPLTYCLWESMFQTLKLNARTVYIFIEFSASIFFAMMFTVTSLYEATVAGLTPVQLILVAQRLKSLHSCSRCRQASWRMCTRAGFRSSSATS